MKTIPFYLATAFILYLGTIPDDFFPRIIGGVALLFATILTLIIFIVQTLKKPIGLNRNRREWKTIGILTFISFFTLVTMFPIRLAYLYSLPELDRMAAEVKAGKKIDLPRRAGFFTISEAEIAFDGYVCLWTSPYHDGFVHCPKSEVHYNLGSHIALGDQWQYIMED
jgi:hypothetical protein